VYWTDDHLRAVDIDGGTPVDLAPANAWSIAIDATDVNWANDAGISSPSNDCGPERLVQSGPRFQRQRTARKARYVNERNF
jgi:hypothetical protein